MKADTIEGLLKEYSQFLEEEKVDLLREEGGRLWRANNELKKEIAMGEKKVKDFDELIARHKATLDLLAKPTRPALDKEDILEQIEHLFFEIKHDNLEKSCILNAAHILHNRIKGGAFDLPKRWVLNRTFTYSGMFGPGPTPEEIKSAEETMSKYKPETEPAKTPIQKAEDLVGFYNKPGPAECGCIDKAKLLEELDKMLEYNRNQLEEDKKREDYRTAIVRQARREVEEALKDAIESGDFDRAPCKPESTTMTTGTPPNPDLIATTGNIKIEQVSGPAKVRYDKNGKYEPSPERHEGEPVDKAHIINLLTCILQDFDCRGPIAGANTLVAVQRSIEEGVYDLPAASKHPGKGGPLGWTSTKDLIAELTDRPGVHIKDLLHIREGDTWSISGEVPAIVITVADFWRDRS